MAPDERGAGNTVEKRGLNAQRPGARGRFAGPTRPPAAPRGFLGKRGPVRPFFRGSATRRGGCGAFRSRIRRNERRFSLICGLTPHRHGAAADISCQTSHFLASGAPFFQSTPPRAPRPRSPARPAATPRKNRPPKPAKRRKGPRCAGLSYAGSMHAAGARQTLAALRRRIATPTGRPAQFSTSSASRFRWRRRRGLPEACPRPEEPGCTAGWHSLPPCRHRPPPARPSA